MAMGNAPNGEINFNGKIIERDHEVSSKPCLMTPEGTYTDVDHITWSILGSPQKLNN